jgi:hypothetical protein
LLISQQPQTCPLSHITSDEAIFRSLFSKTLSNSILSLIIPSLIDRITMASRSCSDVMVLSSSRNVDLTQQIKELQEQYRTFKQKSASARKELAKRLKTPTMNQGIVYKAKGR